MNNRTVLLSVIFGSGLVLWALEHTFLKGMSVSLFLCIVVAIAATHIVSLLAFQYRWHQEQKKSTGETPPLKWHPFINILVPAKNESRVIESTVRKLFQMDYANFDVWVIDDASTDDTVSILNRLKLEFPRLNILSRAPGSIPGKSAALNDALPLCKGDVICVFDADSSAKPDFFKVILHELEPEHVGAVQAQKRIYEHQKGFLVDCQVSEYAFDTCLQMGRNLVGGVVELRGNGQLVKRAALIDVGGWNNHSITDDLDLSMRLMMHRWDIKFSPLACVFEEAVPTFRGLFRQRKRWAEGSIRRWLDYMIPLQLPSSASLLERFDILAFMAEFAWPALTFLSVADLLTDYYSGAPYNLGLLAFTTVAALITIYVPLYAGLRFYRKDLSPWAAFTSSVIVNTYIFSLWSPCVIVSLWHILFKKRASTWKRTEHFGHSAQLPDAG